MIINFYIDNIIINFLQYKRITLYIAHIIVYVNKYIIWYKDGRDITNSLSKTKHIIVNI